MRLLDYAANVHSQYGEDGIIKKILEILPANDKWCVEFGAWDGQHLSNTSNLRKRGYSAVLIEANKKRFYELVRATRTNKNIVTINAFVGFNEADSLDKLLSETPIPSNFDVLSIDIDGNDYHVWKAVHRYKPKVVLIEFNPTIPTELDFIQPPQPAEKQGASLSSIARLGFEKGYALVCVTTTNAILVDSQYFPLFGITNNGPNVLREDSRHVAYLFSGYDGQLHVKGASRSPWDNRPYSSRIRSGTKSVARCAIRKLISWVGLSS